MTDYDDWLWRQGVPLLTLWIIQTIKSHIEIPNDEDRFMVSDNSVRSVG